MTITIHGTIANEQGYCRWQDEPRLEQRSNGALVAHPGHTEIRFDGGRDYADSHPRPIPVYIDHAGRPIGELVYLCRKNGRLGAVGVIHDVDALDRLPPGPLYWSSSTVGKRSTMYPPLGPPELELRECTITDRPASVGLPPLRIWPGDISGDAWNPRRSAHDMRTAGAGILVEARSATSTHRHRYARTLHVVDDGPPEREQTAVPRPGTHATAVRSGQSGGLLRLPDGTLGELLIHPGGRTLSCH